jgi:hypothetical protein
VNTLLSLAIFDMISFIQDTEQPIFGKMSVIGKQKSNNYNSKNNENNQNQLTYP